ncbi:MAG: hypothetical protein KC609_08545 [Myxococcales bacterium]|nr:hypothetical protein [Myxococcales bacterium]
MRRFLLTTLMLTLLLGVVACNSGHTKSSADAVASSDTTAGSADAVATSDTTAGDIVALDTSVAVDTTTTSDAGTDSDSSPSPDLNAETDSIPPVSCSVDNGGCDPSASCSEAPDGVSCTCKAGSFGDGRNCSPVQGCLNDEYETQAPTPTRDRGCAKLTVCQNDEYETQAPTATSDRVCTKLAVCQNDEYEPQAPTPTSDRGCAKLTVCQNDEYETQAPTATSDRGCTKLTACQNDEYESAPPTATSDRACTKITVCQNDEYETKAPTATSDRTCTKLTVCDPDEYEIVPPTATSDRVCDVCPLNAALTNMHCLCDANTTPVYEGGSLLVRFELISVTVDGEVAEKTGSSIINGDTKSDHVKEFSRDIPPFGVFVLQPYWKTGPVIDLSGTSDVSGLVVQQPAAGEISIGTNAAATTSNDDGSWTVSWTAGSTSFTMVVRPQDRLQSCKSCGNGEKNAGEQCDDGANGDDTDGCDDNCKWIVDNPSGSFTTSWIKLAGTTDQYFRCRKLEKLGKVCQDIEFRQGDFAGGIYDGDAKTVQNALCKSIGSPGWAGYSDWVYTTGPGEGFVSLCGSDPLLCDKSDDDWSNGLGSTGSAEVLRSVECE